MARRAVEYVEADLPVCTRTFGTLPCRASLSGIFTPHDTMAYQFDDGTSSLHGWTHQNFGGGGPETLVGGATYALFSEAGASDASIKLTGISFTSAELNTLRIDIERTANGSSTDLTVFFYPTTGSGYYAYTPFTNPALNTRTLLQLALNDSTVLPYGGASGAFSTKTFNQFRIDFDQTGSGVFKIYSIEMGTLVAGNDRCFNTLFTCQDSVRYNETTETVRFAKDNGGLSKDIYALPIIKSINFVPATLAIGESIGQRSTLSVSLKDRPHSDVGPGFDPYYSNRSYNPYEQGTLFGKLRARHPYLQNRELRYIRGYSDQDLVDMQTRTFIITRAQMSGADGTFLIEAQDVLRLIDRAKAQAPAQSEGYLASAITDTSSTMTLSPTGINTTYTDTGYINISGKEIVRYEKDSMARLDSSCKLLYYFNGADASTTITDSSGNGRNGTANGNAQLDTAVYKYGTAALLCDGTGDYVSVADNNDWDPSGDCTIECWINPTDFTGHMNICGRWSGSAANFWRFRIPTDRSIIFEIVSSSAQVVGLQSANNTIVAGVWQHVALTRSGNNWKIFVNGVIVASVTDTSTFSNLTGTLNIGGNVDATSEWFKGSIDTFAIHHVARWTADFSANLPAPPFSTATVFTIYRAELGTTAVAHSAQDRAQKVLYYVSEDPADIIYDLLVTYAGIDPAWIPLSTWQNETASYLQVNYTGIVADPTSVEKLVSELCKQCALTIWWDDLLALIQLQVLRGISSTATITKDNRINGSFSIEEQPSKRVTQVWVYYGKINPLESDDKSENYRSVAVTLDLEVESAFGQPSIMKIFSRWIPAGGRSIAQRLGELILGRFKSPPRLFKMEIMQRSEEASLIEMGDGIDVESWTLQLPSGAPDTIQAQVTRYDPNPTRPKIEAEEFTFDPTATSITDRTIIIETDINNINIRTIYDSLYPTPTDADTVNVYVNSGVVVGSTSTSTYAMDIGTWPSGTTINLYIDGIVCGMGGRGGDGGNVYTGSGAGSNGAAGGPALYTRKAINVAGSGVLFGGGGGGGGGGVGPGAPQYGGGGGGGGRGRSGGSGGDAGRGTLTYGSGGDAGNVTAPGTGGSSGGGSGGTGGQRGAAGSSGGSGSYGAGSGGAAGKAIDGNSYVTETGALTILGTRV